MKTQNHTSHDTRSRGPGTELSASSVVTRSTIATRASSTCTNTFTTHARSTNHKRKKPLAAPTFGVTISSPDPTMAALMMRPGPRWEAVANQPRGGLATASRSRLADEATCVLELGAVGLWVTGYLQQLFVERDRSVAPAGCLCGPRAS